MFMRALANIAGAVAIAATVCGSAGAAEDVATQAQVCTGCHGENGMAADAMTPTIWGQQSSYLYKQLHNYKSGERANSVMAVVVKDISLPDLRRLANYFAAKNWPPALTASAAGAAPGAAPEGIAMCGACHQQNFAGGDPAPRLAGLTYEYLVASMRSFADGERTNNLDMPGFMRALSDGQREAMARYLAGQ